MVSKRWLRKLVPSTAVLSRSALFYPLSVIDDWTVGAACRLVTKRRFPPMRYISRTGCNDVLSPYFFYLTHGVNFWLYAFAQRLGKPEFADRGYRQRMRQERCGSARF